jgi:GTPase SAR1 family protein
MRSGQSIERPLSRIEPNYWLRFSKDLEASSRSENELISLGYCRVIMTMLIFISYRQERYKSIIQMYFRGAHAAVIVYDITNEVRDIKLNSHTSVGQLFAS